MRKFHVINDTSTQEFSKKLEEFCKNHTLIANILYRTNTVQTIEYIDNDCTIEHVLTNYSALIQYQ